jgi:hypothetical protein
VQDQYFLSSEYIFLLVIMLLILRNETDSEQELILESDSEEAVSCENDGGYQQV